MKFTVKRSNWYRGHGNHADGVMMNASKLLREDGQRCCIGFVGQQCGYDDGDLLGIGTIDLVSTGIENNRWPGWMLRKPGWPGGSAESDIYQCYVTNDTNSISDEQREAKLKEIFAKNGDEIEFVD